MVSQAARRNHRLGRLMAMAGFTSHKAFARGPVSVCRVGSAGRVRSHIGQPLAARGGAEG